MTAVTALPWWTETDDAELSALVWELVDGIPDHREACASCARDDGRPCPHISRAIAVVTDWLYGRELFSRARYFRLRRELYEVALERYRITSS